MLRQAPDSLATRRNFSFDLLFLIQQRWLLLSKELCSPLSTCMGLAGQQMHQEMFCLVLCCVAAHQCWLSSCSPRAPGNPLTISNCLVKTNRLAGDLCLLYRDLQFQEKILRIQQQGEGKEWKKGKKKGKVLTQADAFCYLSQTLGFRAGFDFSLEPA